MMHSLSFRGGGSVSENQDLRGYFCQECFLSRHLHITAHFILVCESIKTTYAQVDVRFILTSRPEILTSMGHF